MSTSPAWTYEDDVTVSGKINKAHAMISQRDI